MDIASINQKSCLEMEDFLFLKVGKDQYSNWTHEQLRDAIMQKYPLEGWEMVKEIYYKLYSKRDMQLSAMRWMLRGLRLELALQLVRHNFIQYKGYTVDATSC